METFTIKDLPGTERPYERFNLVGVNLLSDSELLAIILRTGSKDKNVLDLAREVLKLCDDGNDLSALINLSKNSLLKIKGIGDVKAAQLLCIGEISKRIAASRAKTRLKFDNPKTVADYYMEKMRHLEQENFVSVMLDAKSKMICDRCISIGSISSTIVSPREIFREALKFNAVSILVLHNHPSGDSRPSDQDLNVTRRLCELGNLLGIKLVDHIVIGDGEYYSFKEKGIL